MARGRPKKVQTEQEPLKVEFVEKEPDQSLNNTDSKSVSKEPELVEIEEVLPAKQVETFTYVGSGTDIPEVCNFMGRQRFIRFEETEVTDPVVLKKIHINNCFVKGPADRSEIFERDEAEKARVERQKQENNRLQNLEARRNQKFK